MGDHQALNARGFLYRDVLNQPLYCLWDAVSPMERLGMFPKIVGKVVQYRRHHVFEVPWIRQNNQLLWTGTKIRYVQGTVSCGGNLDRYLVSGTGNVTAMALILNCFHMGISADQVIGSENSQVVMAERKKG